MPKRKNKSLLDLLSLDEESINAELVNILNSVKGTVQEAFTKEQPKIKTVNKENPFNTSKPFTIEVEIKNETDEERFKKAKDITNKVK